MLAGRDINYFIGIFTMTATWVGGGYINGKLNGCPSCHLVSNKNIEFCNRVNPVLGIFNMLLNHAIL